MCGDLQPESCGWLFKSLLAGAGAYCGFVAASLQAAQLITQFTAKCSTVPETFTLLTVM